MQDQGPIWLALSEVPSGFADAQPFAPSFHCFLPMYLYQWFLESELSFLFMINLLFSSYNYLPIHMPEHCIYSWSPSKPEEGAASTRTRIIESWWVTNLSRNWTWVPLKQSLDCWAISPVHKFSLIFLWEHNLPHYYFKLPISEYCHILMLWNYNFQHVHCGTYFYICISLIPWVCNFMYKHCLLKEIIHKYIKWGILKWVSFL